MYASSYSSYVTYMKDGYHMPNVMAVLSVFNIFHVTI